MAAEDWRKLLDGKSPTTEQVQKIHERSDKDGSPKAIHHTLGPTANQAAAGNHTHDGGNSAQLLTNITFTGSRATTASMITQFLAAFVALGASDNTTP